MCFDEAKCAQHVTRVQIVDAPYPRRSTTNSQANDHKTFPAFVDVHVRWRMFARRPKNLDAKSVAPHDGRH